MPTFLGEHSNFTSFLITNAELFPLAFALLNENSPKGLYCLLGEFDPMIREREIRN